MTVQIDSLAIGTDNADIATADVDRLFDEISTLDANILDAIERRTDLARTLAAATPDAAASDQVADPYADLGNDGHVFSRMLSRLAQISR
ncbi:chorismate mutase [Rhodococcus sp. 077-4]|uniref:chorismate mutase n=1 Tax=Rhodococcus sp. 077-4 TaxID=2789271 RepID=UPI0039F59BDE